MNPLTLIVPAPCSFITANDRRPWQSTYRMTRAWKNAARNAALDEFGSGVGPMRLHRRIGHPVHIIATIHRNHTRAGRWDPTNWAPTAKAIVDGLVLSGLLVDDDLTRVTGPDMRPGEGRPGGACIVLELIPNIGAIAPAPTQALAGDAAPWWSG